MRTREGRVGWAAKDEEEKGKGGAAKEKEKEEGRLGLSFHPLHHQQEQRRQGARIVGKGWGGKHRTP